jgi:pimaricinolide synthase PimS1
MDAATPGGHMIAIEATPEELQPHLTDTLTIAAHNTPTSTVISGDADTADTIAAHFRAQGRRTKTLTVSHAFHSPHMQPALHDFETVAQSVTYHPTTIPLISNLTGQTTTPEQLHDPAYWTQLITHPVHWAHTITTLNTTNTTHYLELGPDTTLTTLTTHNLNQRPHDAAEGSPDGTAPATPVVVPVLRPGRSETHTLLSALATLHTTGIAPDWHHGDPEPLPDLPTYPFEHQSYWISAAPRGCVRTSTRC